MAVRFSRSLLELGVGLPQRGAQGTRSALAGDTQSAQGAFWDRKRRNLERDKRQPQWTVSGLTPSNHHAGLCG